MAHKGTTSIFHHDGIRGLMIAQGAGVQKQIDPNLNFC